MRGSRPRVYLAGPITGLTYEGATDWRDKVTAALLPGIIGVSPMRGKEYLTDIGEIGGSPIEQYMSNIMSTPKSIVCRDRFDCTTCDAVLMNVLGAKRVSVGTMIEAGWADGARVPLILVIEPEGKQLHERNAAQQPSTDPALIPINPHYHAMLDQIAGYVVPTVEQAVHVLKTMFYRRG